VQSGDETGSASCVSAAEAPITPGEQSHRRESCRTGVLVCTSSRRYERRGMVEPRAWGNFMIRRQRVIEEVFMPRQAASRAPRLADVDKPRAVRRLNTCGMRSLSPEVYHSTSRDGKTNRHGFAKALYEPRIKSNNNSTRGWAESDGAVPGLQLQHKGDKPFRAPHILLIPLAQLRLEDVLFYMDTVTHAKQRTSHNDEQTQPVCQAESQSE